MTVSNTTASITLPGNDSATSFAFNFEIPYQADGVTPAVAAYITVLNGDTETLVLNTDFSITGVGNDFPTGGTVTYPISGTPLGTGDTITIYRALDYVQPYSFTNVNFAPSNIETALDTIAFLLQQLNAIQQAAVIPRVVNSINGLIGTVVINLAQSQNILVLAPATTWSVADGVGYWMVPNCYTSIALTSVAVAVVTASSSGLPNVQINNLATGLDILSTPITLDVGETTSITAATPPVIDPARNALTAGTVLRFDVDTAGTDTAGMIVILGFIVG